MQPFSLVHAFKGRLHKRREEKSEARLIMYSVKCYYSSHIYWGLIFAWYLLLNSRCRCEGVWKKMYMKMSCSNNGYSNSIITPLEGIKVNLEPPTHYSHSSPALDKLFFCSITLSCIWIISIDRCCFSWTITVCILFSPVLDPLPPHTSRYINLPSTNEYIQYSIKKSHSIQ